MPIIGDGDVIADRLKEYFVSKNEDDKNKVLAYVQEHPYLITAENIAKELNIEEESAFYAIKDLRFDGHNINPYPNQDASDIKCQWRYTN